MRTRQRAQAGDLPLAAPVYRPGALCYTNDMTIDDPILIRFRDAVKALYGDTIERIVLYGSRARGDARPDSDYDVAVFLNEPDSFYTETGRLAKIGNDILFDNGALVNALPFDAGSWRDRTGFMHELRKDGVDL